MIRPGRNTFLFSRRFPAVSGSRPRSCIRPVCCVRSVRLTSPFSSLCIIRFFRPDARRLLQSLRRHAVQHQLGEQRLHLRQIGRLRQTAAQIRQLLLLFQRDLLDQKGFPDLLEKRPILRADLIEHPVGEPVQRRDLQIQDAFPRMKADKLPLHLHRRLLRHNHKEPPFRPLHRLPDHFLHHCRRLAGPAPADIEL